MEESKKQKAHKAQSKKTNFDLLIKPWTQLPEDGGDSPTPHLYYPIYYTQTLMGNMPVHLLRCVHIPYHTHFLDPHSSEILYHRRGHRDRIELSCIYPVQVLNATTQWAMHLRIGGRHLIMMRVYRAKRRWSSHCYQTLCRRIPHCSPINEYYNKS